MSEGTKRRLTEIVSAGVVGAVRNDRSHVITEHRSDFGQSFQASLVLYCVMKQPRDGLVLVTAMFNHEGCNGHQVLHVWDGPAFAPLIAVQPVSIKKRFIESFY